MALPGCQGTLEGLRGTQRGDPSRWAPPKDPAVEGWAEERREKGVPSMAACARETVCTDGENGEQAGSTPVMGAGVGSRLGSGAPTALCGRSAGLALTQGT